MKCAIRNALEVGRQAQLDTGVGYRINETNSFYSGGKPGVSDTFARYSRKLWMTAASGGGFGNFDSIDKLYP